MPSSIRGLRPLPPWNFAERTEGELHHYNAPYQLTHSRAQKPSADLVQIAFSFRRHDRTSHRLF